MLHKTTNGRGSGILYEHHCWSARAAGTVKAEFFDLTFRTTLYTTLKALQAELDAWLIHHNTDGSNKPWVAIRP